MKPTKPIIAITLGDAAGIGPEIVLKAVQDETVHRCCFPIIIGSAKVLEFYAERYKINLSFNPVQSMDDVKYSSDIINIIDTNNVLLSELEIGENDPANGIAVLKDTEKAIELALNKQVDAVIAGPHTKKSIELAGYHFEGYPGFVAEKTNTDLDDTFLMLVSKGFRIVNVTLHVSLKEAVNMVKKDLVLKAIRAANHAVQKLGITEPKIGVAGLNPHAGEDGMFGTEEIYEINPAIKEAQDDGINVSGPFGSDSLFVNFKENPYDAYIAMYHDQAHIPIKLVAFNKVTAFTIGTPILFCTVGHGSAPDIAGQGVANPNSLIETIRLISPLSR